MYEKMQTIDKIKDIMKETQLFNDNIKRLWKKKRSYSMTISKDYGRRNAAIQ